MGALYQLQLVKSEDVRSRASLGMGRVPTLGLACHTAASLLSHAQARAYIPDNFKLVELFGHTLGGFYLARYEDSPVGAFDELVVMAGLVWNAPTSCAWAARVFVNNREARDHGLQHVGLPSRLAAFTEAPPVPADALSGSSPTCCRENGQRGQRLGWWRQGKAQWAATGGQRGGDEAPQGGVQISSVEAMGSARRRAAAAPLPVCTLQLPPALGDGQFAGPRIRMALPSFSGATPACPDLLKYACQLWTSVRFVTPAAVQVPPRQPGAGGQGDSSEAAGEDLGPLLTGRPVLTMAFERMEMTVQEPERLTLPQRPLQPATGIQASSS